MTKQNNKTKQNKTKQNKNKIKKNSSIVWSAGEAAPAPAPEAEMGTRVKCVFTSLYVCACVFVVCLSTNLHSGQWWRLKKRPRLIREGSASCAFLADSTYKQYSTYKYISVPPVPSHTWRCVWWCGVRTCVCQRERERERGGSVCVCVRYVYTYAGMPW